MEETNLVHMRAYAHFLAARAVALPLTVELLRPYEMLKDVRIEVPKSIETRYSRQAKAGDDDIQQQHA